MNEPFTSVLLDTDIGTNIDDVLSLSYLLAQPRCRLLGITTVGTDAHRRAALARHVCRDFGRSRIPIHAGHSPERLIPGRPHDPWQADLFLCGAAGPAPHPRAAVEYLASTIHEHPHEIVLLTIGPLTNVAHLVRQHPDAIRLLRGVVSMCGLFGPPPGDYGLVETNVGLDPSAAAQVFDAGLPDHHLLGLDQTGKFEMQVRRLTDNLRGGPPTLTQLAQAWDLRHGTVRLHDVFAAEILFVPDRFQFVPATCAVVTEPQTRAGETAAQRDSGTAKHRVLTSLESEILAAHFFDTLTASFDGPAHDF